MVGAGLEDVFPGLRGQNYQITSPREHRYNCVAFAAGDDRNWWWPDEAEEDYWPPGVARVQSMDAFHAAFSTLGYVVCDNDELEPAFEKVAVFALDGLPQHVARQLPNGRWVSKLGHNEDIEHVLHDLTGTVYGAVAAVMKRAAATARIDSTQGTSVDG